MISKFPKYLNFDVNNFVLINDKKIFVDNWSSTMSLTILQFCEFLNISVPRFCYHDKLSVAGNCRMCMVELKSSFKPVIACATSIMKKMQIYVNSFFVKQARENVMEFLLINHPLDCPICDQGSECDLQDQAVTFGSDRGRFSEIKRSVQDLFMGPVVKTIMTRCIHCTRCVRFSEEVVGNYMLGTLGRGKMTEIGSYYKQPFIDELSGNIVDLCPVGALTSKSYAFKARAWELKSIESIDIFDSLGSNIRVDVKGNEIMRILPKRNDYLNEEWITDKIRFSYEGLKKNRIVYPMFRVSKYEPLVTISYQRFFSELSNRLINYKKNLRKFVNIELSNHFTSALDFFIIYNFFSYLGINNITYKGSELFNPDFRLNYLLNCNLNEFSNNNLYLFNNINLKKENPVLNSRIKKLKLNNGNNVKISYIGPNINLNYDFFHLSNNSLTLFNILEAKHFYSYYLFLSKSNRFINGVGSHINNSLFSHLDYLRKINLNYSSILPNSSSVTFFDLGYDISNVNNYKKNDYFGSVLYMYNMEYSKESEENYKQASTVIYHGTNIDEKIKKISSFIIPSTSFFEEKLFFSNMLGYSQYTNISVSSIPTQFFSIKELFLNFNNDLYKILSKFKDNKNILNLFFSSINCELLIGKNNIFIDIYPYINVGSFFKNINLSVSYSHLNYINYNFKSENIEDYYKTDNLILNSETLQKSSIIISNSKNNFMKNLKNYEYIL
jgi:NADH dehydrogenase (ubiquinone) Fe-S protein 1